MYQEWILTLFLISIPVLASYLAVKRGRNPYAWFAIGFLIGLFGILLLLYLPSLNEEDEEEEEVRELSEDEKVFWYYLDSNHQQHGPVKQAVLKEKIQANEVNYTHLVWKQGMGEWKRVEEFPYLRSE